MQTAITSTDVRQKGGPNNGPISANLENEALSERALDGRAFAAEYLTRDEAVILKQVYHALSADRAEENDLRLKAGVLGELRAVIGSKVVIGSSWESLELDKLLLSILKCGDVLDINREGKTLAATGLMRTFCELPTDPKLIKMRQDVVREFDQNPELRQSVAAFLKASNATDLLMLLRPLRWGDDIYRYYETRKSIVERFVEPLKFLGNAESPLLKEIFGRLVDFKNSEVTKLLRTGATYTFEGVKPTCDVPVTAHGFRFWPYPINPIVALSWAASAGAALSGFIFAEAGERELGTTMLVGAAISSGLSLALMGGKKATDRFFVVAPIAEKAKRQLPSVLNAIATLHELFSLSEFGREAKSATCYPNIIDAEEYVFVAEKMSSPLHYLDPLFVANDVEIADSQVTTLMGPNSGGKSTYVKGILNNTVLGQSGARCLAENCKLAPADRIGFTVPRQNDSADAEGRYGKELAGLAVHLDLSIGPKTVLGIDEIGSGTSELAAIPKAVKVIDTFQHCQVRTLLSTHNFGLPVALEKAGVLIAQLHPEGIVESKPNSPGKTVRLTHRILKGPLPPEADPALYVQAVEERVGLGDEVLEGFKQRWDTKQQVPKA